MDPVTLSIIGAIFLILISGISAVKQGNIVVITMFGKYRRLLYPGLNF